MKNYKILLIAAFFISISIPISTWAADPVSVSCSPNISAIQSGDSVTWSAEVSGGDESYTYDWSDEDGNSGSDETFDATYSTASDNITISKIAELTVTDGLGESATAECEVTIIGELTFSSCSANEVSGETGVPIDWSANVVGGLEPYTFAWTGSDGLSGDSDLVSKNYTSPGTKTASITAISSDDGQTIVGPFDCGSVEIYSTPTVLTATCSAASSKVKQNALATWDATISGGSAPYSITWTGSDGLSGESETITKTYTTVGIKTATIFVSSNDGQMVTGVSCDLEVEKRSGGGGSNDNDDDNDTSTSTTTDNTASTTDELVDEDVTPNPNPIFVINNTNNNGLVLGTTTEAIATTTGTSTPEIDESNDSGLEDDNTSDRFQAAAFMAFVGDNSIWFGTGALIFLILILIGIYLKRKNNQNQ